MAHIPSLIVLAMVLVLIAPVNNHAQVRHTKEAIHTAMGNPDQEGTVYGYNYMAYNTTHNTEDNLTYETIKVIFLVTADDGVEFCSYLKIFSPIFLLDTITDNLNEWYEKFDENKWRDPETELMYMLAEAENKCVIMVWKPGDKE